MASKRLRRGPRNLAAGSLMLHIDSFTLDLQARGRSDRTVKMYRDAVAWFAGEHLLTGGEPNAIDTAFTPADKAFQFTPVSDWEQVTRQHVQSWVVRLPAASTATAT